MKSYIEETLKFIESAEMRDYLRMRTDWFGTDCKGGRKCAEIVSHAPAPLEKKITALELIAEQTEHDPEWDYRDPAKLAKETRSALDECYENPLGTVFLLRSKHFEDYSIFTAFDSATLYLNEYEKTAVNPKRSGFVWYAIEKWIPGKDGKMEMYCTWILNTDGEIWYFSYEHKFEPEDWNELYDYHGNLTLPVPFHLGDIILADCRPFAEPKRVLIITLDGEEDDCCSLQCLFVRTDGKIDAGAFNHNDFLIYPEISHMSGHYRAVLYNGEFSGFEAPLGIISAAVKINPKLGADMHSYICENNLKHSRGRGYRGITWKQLKNNFGL